MRIKYFLFNVYWIFNVVEFLKPAPVNIINFMKKYGYLNNENFKNGIPENDEKFKNAVAEMQTFGKLPVTGKLDKNTVQLTKAFRCGVKDVEREENGIFDYSFVGKGWTKRNISYFLTNTTAKLSREIILENIEKALKLWKSVSPLNFYPAEDERSADMVFTFYRRKHGPRWDTPFDGTGYEVAHAWPPKPGHLFSGHIHFDEDENWIDRTKIKGKWQGVDFYTTVVHELGHSMGLNHSSVNNSVMSPYYTDYKDKLRLGYDDALAMYKLYVEGQKFGKNTFPYPDAKDYKLPILSPRDCFGSFDAVVFFAGYVTFFKGNAFWEMGHNFGTYRGFWLFASHMKFTEVIEGIDAAYRRYTDGKTIFFTGKQFWIFVGAEPEKISPQPLTTLGFDETVSSIDAAMNWKKDRKTYFFKGDQYWCYNENSSSMEDGYPRSIKEWKYAPNNIDCALSLENGSTYFFKDIYYWEVNNDGHLLNHNKPNLAKDWLGCR